MRLALCCLLVAACGASTRPDGAGSAPFARGTTIFPPGQVGTKVSLAIDNKQVDVDLSEVPQKDGRVRLRDLWLAGLPTDEPMLLHFDLVNHQGFTPSTRQGCRQPLNGSDFRSASMDVKTHDVSYDDGHDIADCYRLRGVVRIVGMR